MAEEYKQKDNSGSLFTNGRKEKETHPDFTGRIKIGDDLLEAIRNGDELQLSGWRKTTKNGQAWVSLSVGKVYRKPENPTPRAAPPSLDDEEAPF